MERRTFLAGAASTLAWLNAPATLAQPNALRQVEVRPGITLNYTDSGQGRPIVFVHGSLDDYRRWQPIVGMLSDRYRVISYSRRYNFPNHNDPATGYSAKADAADLAALIDSLQLEQPYLVGHSYGAFASLFFLLANPGRVRAAVLAEPPAVPLLAEYPPSPPLGRTMLLDVQNKLEAPLARAFEAGDREAGLRAFFDYVAFPGFDQVLPPEARAQALANSVEWEVAFRDGELFPAISAAEVRGISTPILLLAGSQTNPFLMMIHETLGAILPDSESVVIEGAPHPMFETHPGESVAALSGFFGKH